MSSICQKLIEASEFFCPKVFGAIIVKIGKNFYRELLIYFLDEVDETEFEMEYNGLFLEKVNYLIGGLK